jgi:hypothetical protein
MLSKPKTNSMKCTGMKEIKTLELSFILFGRGLSVNILLLSGEDGWEFLILFVTTRPNEKQLEPSIWEAKVESTFMIHRAKR